ncbi:RNA-binding S4 domain-containing protein [Desulfolucianica intricata]|uniref:RNA-binding S4 domain-containing protein n=1 Tax=Desulfolucanica intricata TaxID=1285191 RepID=UPI00082F2F03
MGVINLIKDVEVSGPIKLDQFLKWANIASTGGHAKILIQTGNVKVNGAVELRRGRVLKKDDQVQIDDQSVYRVFIKDKECK